MKIDSPHWRNYFGGVCLVLLVLQVLSGIFLALYYSPHLAEAYVSIQYIYKQFPDAAWVRDSHRWISFFVFAGIIAHVARSLLRRDFLNAEGKSFWLTGCLLALLLGGSLVTGSILPWDWKGYWFMEMVPNYLANLPLIGPSLKAYFIDGFTMERNFVTHVVILPLIAIVLIEIHALTRVRRRQLRVSGYLGRHALLSLPVIIAVVVLAVLFPMPTEDPEIIPMPLEGAFLPVTEWFSLIFFVPFIYFKNWVAPMLGIYLPAALFAGLSVLPFYFALRRPGAETGEAANGAAAGRGMVAKIGGFVAVIAVIGSVYGLLFLGNYKSPTFGCNSCHNTSMGRRMGIPPKAFKDRKIVPLLNDSQWMTEHWFTPQTRW